MSPKNVFHRYVLLFVLTMALMGAVLVVSFSHQNRSHDIRVGVEDTGESEASIDTRQMDPLVSLVSPEGGYKGSSHEIIGEFFNDTKGRVGLEPFLGGGIIWLAPGDIDSWSTNSINFTIPSNITEGLYYVLVRRPDGATRSWMGVFQVAKQPKITGVSPKDDIYEGTEINITGEGFGDLEGEVIFLRGTEDEESNPPYGTVIEWNKTYITVVVPAYSDLKGTVRIVVVASGISSEPFKIKLKATVTIVDPEENEELSGVVTIELKYRKGTETINVTISPVSSGSYGGSGDSEGPVFQKEYKVSQDSTSKEITWDTTEVENQKHYSIHISVHGSYGSGGTSVEVYVNQKPANVITVALVATASVGVAAGVGAAAASGGAGAAGAGMVPGATGGEHWLWKLIAKLRSLFGDVIEEKAEDLVEKGAEKLDDRFRPSGDVKEEMMKGVPIKAFAISLGIATIAFSMFINGGIFGWRGWWPSFPISFGIALVVVTALMGVKNIFGFWIASKINLKRRWRMGIVGLLLLLISAPLGSPMGEIGELEDGDMKYSKRARKHLKAFGVMSSSLVVLSMLIIFGSLSIFENDFIRFNVAYPGAFACLALAFFPLMPFKSSPGHAIWKWNRAVSIGMLVVIFGLLISFVQLWIPGWSLLLVGGFSAVILLVFLFAFGTLDDFSSKGEIKARKYVIRAFDDDFDIREDARRELIKIMVKRPATLRECIPDILTADVDSEEIRREILDLVTEGVEIAPWLFIPYRESLLRVKEDTPESERERWKSIADTLEMREWNFKELPDENMRKPIIKLIKPRELDRKEDENDVRKEKKEDEDDQGEKGKEKEEDELIPPPMPPDEEKPEPESEKAPEKPPSDEKADEKKCGKCGAEMSPPYRFCTACGNRTDDEKDEKGGDDGKKRGEEEFDLDLGEEDIADDERAGEAPPPPKEAPEMLPEEPPESGSEDDWEEDGSEGDDEKVEENFGSARRHSDVTEDDDDEEVFDIETVPMEPTPEMMALPEGSGDDDEGGDNESPFDFTDPADDGSDDGEGDEDDGEGEDKDLPPWLRH